MIKPNTSKVPDWHDVKIKVIPFKKWNPFSYNKGVFARKTITVNSWRLYEEMEYRKARHFRKGKKWVWEPIYEDYLYLHEMGHVEYWENLVKKHGAFRAWFIYFFKGVLGFFYYPWGLESYADQYNTILLPRQKKR